MIKMTPDRVMVWKFDTAPADLQALYAGTVSPRWVALIPAAIDGPDLQAAIEAQSGVEKHSVEGGDVAYIGASDVTEFLELVGNLSDSGHAAFGSRSSDS
jgi:hypothetical protein